MTRPFVAAPDTRDTHKHVWKTLAHMDGCHWYGWSYACECGARYETYAERDLDADPYSLVWMDPEGREPCERCEELIAGAKPACRETITEPGAAS